MPKHRALNALTQSPMYWLFAASYTIVHIIFEYKFWVTGGGAIFAKYEPSGVLAEQLSIGERVYYAKATWCFLMIWLQFLGTRFKTALAWSFMVYAVELLLLFPVRPYALLNVLLALGMVIEVLLQRRQAPNPAA